MGNNSVPDERPLAPLPALHFYYLFFFYYYYYYHYHHRFSLAVVLFTLGKINSHLVGGEKRKRGDGGKLNREEKID